MCLAVPGRVTRIWEADGTTMAAVDYGNGVVKEASLRFVPDLRIGEYTIVHLGCALQRIDEETALRTIELFAEMEELEAGLGDAWQAQQAEDR